LIKFSSFLENPVVPITTLFLSFAAIFKTSNVHLGTVKSIIKLAFLKACSVFKLGVIPLTFLLIILFSLIAILILILPAFLRANSKLKQFVTNLSIWAIIVLGVMIVSYLVLK